MKILINSDIYNVCKRIKIFDKKYFLVYDSEVNKYQIYSSENFGNVININGQTFSYVCTLPFDEIDARAINYLHHTSSENIENLIDEIEKQNNQLEYENNVKITNQSLSIAEQTLRQLTK